MSKTFIVIIAVFIVFLLIYLAMFFSTNQLKEYVEKVMGGKVAPEDTDGTPLDRYNIGKYCSNAQVDVSITRLFTIHDFSDGYIWVKYSYVAKKNDEGLHMASIDVISRWKIHRENGEWKVVEIVEDP